MEKTKDAILSLEEGFNTKQAQDLVVEIRKVETSGQKAVLRKKWKEESLNRSHACAHSFRDIKQQFENMKMVDQQMPGKSENNNGAEIMDQEFSANQQDIIILGGHYAPGDESISRTVEKYNIAEGKSTLLPSMNLARTQSASCVYRDSVIVAGGFNGQDGTDSIESLNMNQHPLGWTTFDVKLPVKLSGHDLKLYQDKLYITGGHNWNENTVSNAIYEQSLVPPYVVKLLAKMPNPRRNHRAEIIDGKLFVTGGKTTIFNEDSINGVLVYDFINNDITTRSSPPMSVRLMSTVARGKTVIFFGGKDENDQATNDVIMYDTETRQSERLPSLNHKRFAASAVVMHDDIVVLGGWNREEGHLNSVESFTMGDDQWKELPGMQEKRAYATAVVIPRN